MTKRASFSGRSLAVGLSVFSWMLCEPSLSAAQVRVRPGLVEVGGGLALTGSAELGSAEATMTSNQGGIPTRYNFFKVDNRIDAERAVAAWGGVNVTPTIGIEVSFERSRPALKTMVTGDAEGVVTTTLATSSIRQDIVGGNFLFYGNGLRYDGQRTVPFLLVGAGYLRQQDDEQEIKETGRIYQIGLGFKWVARIARSGRAGGPGLRLDVRYRVRDGGFDVEEGIRRRFLTGSLTGMIAF